MEIIKNLMFFFFLLASIYSIIFFIFSLDLLLIFPDKISDIETPNSFDRGISSDISGVPLPVSHRDIAFSVTLSFLASSAYVKFFSFLFVLIRVDIFSKFIITFLS